MSGGRWKAVHTRGSFPSSPSPSFRIYSSHTTPSSLVIVSQAWARRPPGVLGLPSPFLLFLNTACPRGFHLGLVPGQLGPTASAPCDELLTLHFYFRCLPQTSVLNVPALSEIRSLPNTAFFARGARNAKHSAFLAPQLPTSSPP